MRSSFVVGFLSLVLLLGWMGWKLAPRDLPPPPRRELPTSSLLGAEPRGLGWIVCARTEIAAGEQIGRRLVEEVPFPEEMTSVGMAQSVSDVVGKVALETILEGEMVLLGRIADPGWNDASPPFDALGDHEGAITLEVAAASAAGGFIQQGDHVDVVACFPERGGRPARCMTVLQNAMVMASGTRYEGRLTRSMGDRIQAPDTPGARLTLAADASDIARLLHIRHRTKDLHIVLRQPADAETLEPAEGTSILALASDEPTAAVVTVATWLGGSRRVDRVSPEPDVQAAPADSAASEPTTYPPDSFDSIFDM